MCACVCMYPWRPGVNLGCSSSCAICLVFLRWGFSLAWNLPISSGWLSSKSQRLAYLCLPSAYIQTVCAGIHVDVRGQHLDRLRDQSLCTYFHSSSMLLAHVPCLTWRLRITYSTEASVHSVCTHAVSLPPLCVCLCPSRPCWNY